MAYKALYRTYRPTTFDEVAGQQHIVKTLKNALATGKIAHAYLFAGPRGTGKTTMAKLFAKALNCDEGIGHQCNQCKNCLGIIDGSHPDVLELDAASNNGVEEIRNLIERVKYGTILGKYKVYIIDEVHMLSVPAFNALLKTLEEPPEHVVFILATTEPHEIIPTILSRCQRYDFTKVSDADIKGRIKVVLENEQITYNDKAVDLIVSMADGGMRDALSILDQVLAYSGNTLNEDDILNIFSLESKEEKIALISSIANHDVADVLDRLNKYITKGTDIKRLTNDILLILKDALIFESSHRADFLENIDRVDAKYINDLLPNEYLLKLIEILMNALKEYKYISDINPLFEVTLLKMTLGEQKAKIVPQKVEETSVKPEPIEKPKPQNIEEKKEELPKKEEIIPESPIFDKHMEVPEVKEIIYINGTDKEESFECDDDTIINIMVTSKKEMKSEAKDLWANIKKFTMHPTLGKTASLLVDSHPLVASNKAIVLESPLPKLAEAINKIEVQKEIQTIIQAIFGKQKFIYALPHLESVRLQQKYLSLVQVGKLPKSNEVTIDYIGD